MATTFQNNHGSLMDQVYRWQRHIYDATRKYYLLGRDRMICELDVPHGGTVLELGCGTGRNLVKIAQRWPDCRICGLDISDEMLKTAREAIRRNGLSDRISVARGDAVAFDPGTLFGTTKFDTIVCSYSLSMVPEWQRALRWALSLLASKGRLHIIDFGLQADLPAAFRVAVFAWLRLFHVQPRSDLVHFATSLANMLEWKVSSKRLYRDYCRQVVIEEC